MSKNKQYFQGIRIALKCYVHKHIFNANWQRITPNKYQPIIKQSKALPNAFS